jgi:molecular chaperone GrpE
MSDKKHEHHHNGEKNKPDDTKIEEPIKKEEGAAEAKPASTQTGAENTEAKAEETEPPIDTVDDLKQQLDAQSDRYLRLMAEFDNFKKRVSRDYERLVESANERLMGELIEVRENLERAVRAGEQCADVKSMFDGMKLIFTKFNDVLTRNGLEPFGAVGDQFDPLLHDAMMKMPTSEIPEDHIVEVFEKGYSLKKRVIRHARVIVSGGPAKEEQKTRSS